MHTPKPGPFKYDPPLDVALPRRDLVAEKHRRRLELEKLRRERFAEVLARCEAIWRKPDTLPEVGRVVWNR